jgi:aconitate hydratase
MGILPLQFLPGENPQTLGLDGSETFSTLNLGEDLKPGQTITVQVEHADGRVSTFDTVCRIDTPVEVDYYRNGGILHTVLRNFLAE